MRIEERYGRSPLSKALMCGKSTVSALRTGCRVRTSSTTACHPQFLARFESVVLLEALGERELVRILLEGDSRLAQAQKYLKAYGLDLMLLSGSDSKNRPRSRGASANGSSRPQRHRHPGGGRDRVRPDGSRRGRERGVGRRRPRRTGSGRLGRRPSSATFLPASGGSVGLSEWRSPWAG